MKNHNEQYIYDETHTHYQITRTDQDPQPKKHINYIILLILAFIITFWTIVYYALKTLYYHQLT